MCQAVNLDLLEELGPLSSSPPLYPSFLLPETGYSVTWAATAGEDELNGRSQLVFILH